MKKIILAALVLVLVLGVFPMNVKAQSVKVWPDPWLTIVGGHVSIAGEPAPAGTLVQFYCRGNLAGEGYTIDSPYGEGILPFTFVYGSDLTANPQVLQCEEGDTIDIFVDYVQAVYSPALIWHDDRNTRLIEITSDFEGKFFWSGGDDNEAIPAIGRIAQKSFLQTFFISGKVLNEKIESTPFWRNVPLDTVKAFAVLGSKHAPYVISTHMQSVCPVGPEFLIAQGGETVRIEVLNTTGQNMQAVLRLKDTMNPAGNLLPGGGLSSMTTENLWGEIEVRTPDGQLCSEMVWDFREKTSHQVFLPIIGK